MMDIKLVCIDSGGHYTDQVYQFNRNKGVRWIISIKGSPTHETPIARFPRKMNAKRIYLTMLGGDTAKELIYRRYQITEPGPGYCHYPKPPEFDEDFFRQATSETRGRRFKKGRPVHEWTLTKGVRNEALDCTVYALAAIRILQQHMGLVLKKPEPVKEQPKTERQSSPFARRHSGFDRR